MKVINIIIKFIVKMIKKTMNTKPMKIMTKSLQKNGFTESEARIVLLIGLIAGLPTPIPGGSVLSAGAFFTLAKLIGILGIVILIKKVLKMKKNIA